MDDIDQNDDLEQVTSHLTREEAELVQEKVSGDVKKLEEKLS